MNQFSFLFIILFCLILNLKAQEFMFPELECETLNNEVVVLPDALKGKYAFIGMAFTKKAEDDLKTWYNPIYRTFIYKSSKPQIFNFDYDIYAYFIPMVTGLKKAGYKPVMKSAKMKLDKRLHGYILFHSGKSIKSYQEKLNFKNGKVPHSFILDPDGKIIYQTEGKWTQSKMNAIEKVLEPAQG